MGNIIGSNIFNTCVVLGIPVAIFGTITPGSFSYIDLIGLLLSSFILFIFAVTKRTINRVEGLILLLLFELYYILVFVV